MSLFPSKQYFIFVKYANTGYVYCLQLNNYKHWDDAKLHPIQQGTRVLFPGGKTARAQSWPLFPKNESSYNSILPYSFMPCAYEQLYLYFSQ